MNQGVALAIFGLSVAIFVGLVFTDFLDRRIGGAALFRRFGQYAKIAEWVVIMALKLGAILQFGVALNAVFLPMWIPGFGDFAAEVRSDPDAVWRDLKRAGGEGAANP